MLVPTRELALQTSAIVKELSKHLELEVMVTTGGTNLKEDIMRLYSPVHIVVGTPGRIHDLADKKIADLSKVKTIVMDEADKLLSPEFQDILESLISKCSPNRQICLFSATFPVAVKPFKQKFLPNAYIINLMDELTLRGITQYYAFVEEKQKVNCLNTLSIIISERKESDNTFSVFSFMLFLWMFFIKKDRQKTTYPCSTTTLLKDRKP